MIVDVVNRLVHLTGIARHEPLLQEHFDAFTLPSVPLVTSSRYFDPSTLDRSAETPPVHQKPNQSLLLDRQTLHDTCFADVINFPAIVALLHSERGTLLSDSIIGRGALSQAIHLFGKHAKDYVPPHVISPPVKPGVDAISESETVASDDKDLDIVDTDQVDLVRMVGHLQTDGIADVDRLVKVLHACSDLPTLTESEQDYPRDMMDALLDVCSTKIRCGNTLLCADAISTEAIDHLRKREHHSLAGYTQLADKSYAVWSIHPMISTVIVYRRLTSSALDEVSLPSPLNPQLTFTDL